VEHAPPSSFWRVEDNGNEVAQRKNQTELDREAVALTRWVDLMPQAELLQIYILDEL
jgi:hypothetical protein